jgi:hypothetical protein
MMRSFSDLNSSEQATAKEKIFGLLIEELCEGFVGACLWGFEDEIEAAIEESERLQTPWFLAEILVETIERNAKMKKAVDAFVSETAEGSLYPEANENIIVL